MARITEYLFIIVTILVLANMASAHEDVVRCHFGGQKCAVGKAKYKGRAVLPGQICNCRIVNNRLSNKRGIALGYFACFNQRGRVVTVTSAKNFGKGKTVTGYKKVACAKSGLFPRHPDLMD